MSASDAFCSVAKAQARHRANRAVPQACAEACAGVDAISAPAIVATA